MTDAEPAGLPAYSNVPKAEVPGVVALMLATGTKHIDVAADGDDTYKVTPLP